MKRRAEKDIDLKCYVTRTLAIREQLVCDTYEILGGSICNLNVIKSYFMPQ